MQRDILSLQALFKVFRSYRYWHKGIRKHKTYGIYFNNFSGLLVHFRTHFICSVSFIQNHSILCIKKNITILHFIFRCVNIMFQTIFIFIHCVPSKICLLLLLRISPFSLFAFAKMINQAFNVSKAYQCF